MCVRLPSGHRGRSGPADRSNAGHHASHGPCGRRERPWLIRPLSTGHRCSYYSMPKRLAGRRRPELEGPLAGCLAQHADALNRHFIAQSRSLGLGCRTEGASRALPAFSPRVTGCDISFIIRAHPLSADAAPKLPKNPAILRPVLVAPYRQMATRPKGLPAPLGECGDPPTRVRITADSSQMSSSFAIHPCGEIMGQIDQHNRAIAGATHYYFDPADRDSLPHTMKTARTVAVAIDAGLYRERSPKRRLGFTPNDAAKIPDAWSH